MVCRTGTDDAAVARLCVCLYQRLYVLGRECGGVPGSRLFTRGVLGESVLLNKMAPGEENNNSAINLVITFIVIRVMMAVMIIY